MANNDAIIDDRGQLDRYLEVEVYNPRLGNYDYNSQI